MSFCCGRGSERLPAISFSGGVARVVLAWLHSHHHGSPLHEHLSALPLSRARTPTSSGTSGSASTSASAAARSAISSSADGSPGASPTSRPSRKWSTCRALPERRARLRSEGREDGRTARRAQHDRGHLQRPALRARRPRDRGRAGGHARRALPRRTLPVRPVEEQAVLRQQPRRRRLQGFRRGRARRATA